MPALAIAATAWISIGACDFDGRAWEKAQETNTIAAYEEYLSRYEDGKHVMEAGARIEDLTPAEIVMTVEHAKGSRPSDDLVITIKDGAGEELDRYAEEAGRTTHFEYEGGGLRRARSEMRVQLDNGRRSQAKTVTTFDAYETPTRMILYSPDDNTLGTFSLDVEKSSFSTSWEPRVFYTELPFTKYDYDGEKLVEVTEHPEGDLGTEVGGLSDYHVVFSEDVASIVAVVPWADLSEPFAMGEVTIDEIGFLAVSRDGEIELLPYVETTMDEDGDGYRWRRILYTKVPKECRTEFQKFLSTGEPVSGAQRGPPLSYR